MINPLSIASDGYLNTTKQVLSISVSGYLSYAGVIPPQPPMPPTIPIVGGGSGGSFGIKLGSDLVNRQYSKKNYYNNTEPNKFELEDDDVMLIIKTFLKCQK